MGLMTFQSGDTFVHKLRTKDTITSLAEIKQQFMVGKIPLNERSDKPLECEQNFMQL